MTLKAKLLAAFSGIFAVVLGLGVLSFTLTGSAGDLPIPLHTKGNGVFALGMVRAQVRDLVLRSMEAVLFDQPFQQDAIIQASLALKKSVADAKDAISTAEDRAFFLDLEAVIARMETGIEDAQGQWRLGNREAALRRLRSVSEDNFRPVFLPRIEGMIAAKQALIDVHRGTLRRRLANLKLISIVFPLLGALLVVMIAGQLAISIGRRVSALDIATKQIAQGNFLVDLPITGNDELTHLAASFNKMAIALKESKELLDKQQVMIIKSSKMSVLGEMAGGVGHEINNPLAVICMRAEHIKKELAADPPRIETSLRFIGIIATHAQRIATIVHGLKTFSRNAEGDPYESCRIVDIVTATLTLCAERFKQHGIDLRIGTPFAGAVVEARAVQISQVLLNLLTNAYDAIEPLSEKWIEVAFEDRGDRVLIRVTDSGKGIPPEHRERLMQPFFSTKLTGKGTGLGLSIAKGIIEAHHGSLTVDHTSANTCFIISLPKSATHNHPHARVA